MYAIFKIVGATPLRNFRTENVSAKIAVFTAFFERKCYFAAKLSIFDPIVLYMFGKLSI